MKAYTETRRHRRSIRGARRAGPLLLGLGILGGPLACGSAEADRTGPYRGLVLPDPVEKVDFVLTDTEGQPFRFREQTDDYLTFLFFGFTNCPDICPVHMTNLATVLNRFPYDVQSRVRVVFVTTDPDRDTPEVIREWLDRFDRRFIGLHGDFDEVNRLQRAFNLPEAVRSEPRPDGGYDVGHGAQILAFPEGGGAARVTYLFGTRQADWENDLPLLLRGEE